MSNITALKAEFTRITIEGLIRGLAKQLSKLAPHPENPDHRGPLFVSLNSSFKPAAEYDGMMGSLMLEGFLGSAFSDVANDNSGMVSTVFGAAGQNQLDMLGEALSEYLEYQDEQKRGKGTFALGEHKSICNQFNDEVEPAVLAYHADFAKRMDIEEAIAAFTQRLDWATKAAKSPAPVLCAA